MPRLAANLAYLFADRPPLDRFAAAAAVGFRAVELQYPYDQDPAAMRAEIVRSDLIMLGVNTAPLPDAPSGIAGVPGREAEFAALFERALALAVALGGRAIHCLAGVVPEAQREAGEATFVTNLKHAADRAAPHGLTVLIEPLNTVDRPGYLLDRAEQAAAILARVERANVKMQFDLYHQQIMGGDLLRRFERHLPLIGHVQIAAVPSRAEPDEGEVNHAVVLAALDRLGYAGFVGCEYLPRGRTEDGLGWAAPWGIGVRVS
ncbi:TIM barrel protein [Rhodoplanes sp. TEM]|uniref:TIM barrel protein n=1 Tax=Rhodoplanes tepidamans TaxID=200616 RepID=A0ABT5JIC1_RHOTP|nr:MULTISPECIES: TIM barrel protein [Rhodoplanes]MDC7789466.1 TIM barrel protein [Rhodoplanes tepidamans]MDC7986987.1 TIM barrel protein [Rhodoplanes sp. TEM]MDQ0359019.1 hydroxypyruvate isomerase [Rhodoplanes tepidamans]